MKATTAILSAACLGYSMVILDTTVLNVALPSIAAETGAIPAQQQWIVDSYVLVMTALLLAGGGLIDRFGAAKVFRAGVVLFTVASVLCAMTNVASVLIAARVLQGVGGAMLIPATLTVVMMSFPEVLERGRAIAIIATVAASPQAFGPSLGGILVDTLGWRSIFLLNVPIGIATLLFARRLPVGQGNKRPLDITGVVLIVIALGGLTYGIIEYANSQAGVKVIGSLAVAVLAGVAFIMVEKRTSTPLLPGPILNARGLHLYVLAGLFMFVLFYAALFAANLYFQKVLGLSALDSGLLLLPAGVPVFALPIMVSKLAGKKWSPVALTTTGTVIATTGAAMGLLSGVSQSPFVVSASLLVLGIGFGIASPPHLALATSVAPQGTGGVTSALANAGRQAGYLFGVALVGMAGQSTFGYQQAVWIAIAGGVLALVVLVVAATYSRSRSAEGISIEPLTTKAG
ncbi:MFS transporter [Arthrobacter sp. StoSoilB5]|uniref:MFS transporter n=1 Tax=Arthrobacter sp. StoSoilB5 TaxID=2830992 RepID=UPI001CC60C63|nr:MFS transporter [Arthrobacter sp. StoSoilB5]BCW47554.1 MFS transporter [Arthrobacter sp. StoSoilB5]